MAATLTCGIGPERQRSYLLKQQSAPMETRHPDKATMPTDPAVLAKTKETKFIVMGTTEHEARHTRPSGKPPGTFSAQSTSANAVVTTRDTSSGSDDLKRTEELRASSAPETQAIAPV